MGLVKDYSELNKIAEDISKKISEINLKYLNSDVDYPYDEVSKLIGKYDAMLGKVLKKRYSSISEFLSKIDSKRGKIVDELDAPSKYEVLNMASESNIEAILNYLANSRLDDENSKKIVGDKIFPIVKDMDLKNIIYLYRQSKNVVSNDNNTLGYLKDMFVGYIISNIVHNPARGRVRSSVIWTYEEVCENILKEDMLKVDENSRIK